MAELKFAAHLHHSSTAPLRDVDWDTPVLSMQARHDVGVAELLAEVRPHRAALAASGAVAPPPPGRAPAALPPVITAALRAACAGRVDRAVHAGAVKAVFDEVVAGTRDPYSAAAAILPVISLEP